MRSAIDKQFLKTFLVTGIIGSFLNLGIDLYNNIGVSASVISDIVVCFSIVSAYAIYKLYRNYLLSSLLLVCLILPAMVYVFFNSSGYLIGINISVILVSGYFCALIMPYKVRNFFLILIFALLLFLFIYQFIYVQEFNYSFKPSRSYILGLGLPYIAMYVLIVLSASTLKDKFNQQHLKLQLRNGDIKRRNRKIQTQNILLEEQKEELNTANSHLEEEVRKRTGNLRLKNEQLAIYAFKNAHNVRGSLARILGILYLAKMDSNLNKDQLWDMIETEAGELDITLRQISDELHLNTDL